MLALHSPTPCGAVQLAKGEVREVAKTSAASELKEVMEHLRRSEATNGGAVGMAPDASDERGTAEDVDILSPHLHIAPPVNPALTRPAPEQPVAHVDAEPVVVEDAVVDAVSANPDGAPVPVLPISRKAGAFCSMCASPCHDARQRSRVVVLHALQKHGSSAGT